MTILTVGKWLLLRKGQHTKGEQSMCDYMQSTQEQALHLERDLNLSAVPMSTLASKKMPKMSVALGSPLLSFIWAFRYISKEFMSTTSYPRYCRFGTCYPPKSSFLKWFYFIFKREEEGGRKTWRGTSISCLSYPPTQGSNAQPRYMPWWGMELVTFCFAGWCSTNWLMLHFSQEPVHL